MNKKFVILKDYRGFIRQQLSLGSSIDLAPLKKLLSKKSYRVEEYYVDEVINQGISIKDAYVLYSSSQNQDYKLYIDDLLYYLSLDNVLLPRYEIFRAHENKGFQEILKHRIPIKSLNCIYLGTDRDFEKYADQIEYPVVIKRVIGAASCNVYLARCAEEARSLIHKLNTPPGRSRYYLKKYVKKFIFKKKYDPCFYDDSIYLGRYILQQWVPNLCEDWKINIFGQKYYVLHRKVRLNDFRASGSGRFDGIDPPEGLLDYVKDLFIQFDLPFVSFDVCFDGKQFFLLEFQGTHFGPCPLKYTDHYYFQRNNHWEKVTQESDLSEEYANSIIQYLENH